MQGGVERDRALTRPRFSTSKYTSASSSFLALFVRQYFHIIRGEEEVRMGMKQWAQRDGGREIMRLPTTDF